MAFPPSTESRLALLAHQPVDGLSRASAWLKDQCNRQAMPPEHLDRLDLLLNEALANVIDHGGPSALAAPIDLRIRFHRAGGRDEASLTISDAGNPFNPLHHTQRPMPQSLDEATPGGLGIKMMQTLADGLSYAHTDERNHLTLTIRWEQSGACAAPASPAAGARLPPLQRRDEHFLPAEAARSGRGIGWMPLFRGTDEAAVNSVLDQCDMLILAPGTPLLKPGAANDAIFILLSGSLSACLDSDLNPEACIPLEAGECIGEMSAIDGKPVTALVVATTEARIIQVPQDLFFNQLLTVPGVARNLMIALTERMRRTNETMMAAQRKQLDLQHLRQELEVARQLQASMLPLRSPMFPERADVDVAAAMEPASEVGGDLFDVFFVDEHHLFICIGDVSGHGIPAALFMARAIGLMRIAAMGTTRPDELIEKINDQLCTGNETNLFVTLFCGFLNVSTGRLVYSNGGHCAPILVSKTDAVSIPIPKGTLVGAFPGLKYSALNLILEAGDTLVCYTDGVTEAQPGSGEEYSTERLTALLRRESANTPADMMDAVRRAITNFAGNRALDDDYTLIAVRRLAAHE